MKYYKEEIKGVKSDDVLLGEYYHVWSPESIQKFWMIWANNAHLRQQFYPREYFVNFFRQVSAYLSDAECIVDVGCGSGTVLSVLEELGLGRSLIGIDLSEESISPLRRKYKGNQNFSFKVGNIRRLPLEDNICDVVTCTEVLEHLFPEDFEQGLSEVSRVLVTGGYFVATVPLKEKVRFVVCPECHTIFTPHQHMLFEFTEEYLDDKLGEHDLKLIRFFYPVNVTRPDSFIKHVIKNRILIPLFPRIAQRFFPVAGVTGFVAQKKDGK